MSTWEQRMAERAKARAEASRVEPEPYDPTDADWAAVEAEVAEWTPEAIKALRAMPPIGCACIGPVRRDQHRCPCWIRTQAIARAENLRPQA